MIPGILWGPFLDPTNERLRISAESLPMHLKVLEKIESSISYNPNSNTNNKDIDDDAYNDDDVNNESDKENRWIKISRNNNNK